jgi:hypothetical protein
MPYNLMEEYKVENDVYIKNLSKKYCPQFGKIAVDMRFVTAEQLTEALAEQAEDSLSNKPHRLIGSILFENGWITRDQIDFVVLRLFKQKKLIQ